MNSLYKNNREIIKGNNFYFLKQSRKVSKNKDFEISLSKHQANRL